MPVNSLNNWTPYRYGMTHHERLMVIVRFILAMVITVRATKWAHLNLWRGLFALAAQDLGVDLIGAGVEQVHRPIFQCPQVAVQCEVFVALTDALAGHQLRGFDSYRCCLYRLRACRAGRQAEADQPTCEQQDCGS